MTKISDNLYLNFVLVRTVVFAHDQAYIYFHRASKAFVISEPDDVRLLKEHMDRSTTTVIDNT